MIIKTKHLNKVYKLTAEDIYAVKNISFEINAGEFVSIMGPSGSGKTTLLDLLGCLDSVSSGTLEVFGKDVSAFSENQLVKVRRDVIGFVFQDFSLIPSLTALENVTLPAYFSGKKISAAVAKELLDKVGLSHRLHHLPKQMSGGEKQRVAIARALYGDLKLLLADEPTGHLDSKNSEDIFNLFSKLNKEDGLTIIVTTHDEKLGSKAERTLLLKDGQLAN